MKGLTSLKLRRNLAFITASSSLYYFSTIATAAMTSTTTPKVIDSHLHVWASSTEASTDGGFPHVQEPPESLKDRASIAELLQQMDDNSVDGALIVQPAIHKFDHSYVLSAIQSHSNRFKGMLLHDPSLSPTDAVSRLEDLSLQGFVGIRFNPYLWPKLLEGEQEGSSCPASWAPMSQGAGLAVYKRCGELHMPVGVMCFQGLQLHYDDIMALLKASPDTILILDHFGFTSVITESDDQEDKGRDDRDRDRDKNADDVFEKLLALAAYPQVHVKISALFRLGDAPPYTRVHKERFQPLLRAFGADRLMFGSDFPFVLEQPEAYSTVRLVESWIENDQDRAAIMGGTAERLFGPWGSFPPNKKSEL
jgi:predicted TIM-barrel fold metal-dependent hydrolase